LHRNESQSSSVLLPTLATFLTSGFKLGAEELAESSHQFVLHRRLDFQSLEYRRSDFGRCTT
jgi:hypothetical protein